MDDHILDAIDDTIHAKARLGIMSLLAAYGKSDFSFLKEKLGLTEGNLGAHIRTLEDAGYIEVEKTFVGRRPKTFCSPTEKGLGVLRSYIEGLERIIKLAQSAQGNEPKT